MKKAAIIIVNWNGKRFLKNCLNSVFNQTYKDFDVYFVDNGSVDGSSNYVKKNFPKVKIIKLDKNYGFAKGNNEGIKEAFKDKKVEYIVCLNNDTIVDKNWLKELVRTAEKSEKIGAVSSKAYFKDGKNIQNAGLIFSKALQINKLGGISLGYGKTDDEIPKLSHDCEIFCPGGVAPLYKREVLEYLYKRDREIFDEDFFAYVEDLDLGIRIKNLGYTSYLSSKARLIHLHSQTGGVASPFKAYYGERNKILTAIKNLPFFDLILFPFRNIRLKFSYFFKKHESVEKLNENIGFIKMFWIVVKANLSALGLMPKILIKRIKIKKY
ncbi:MAG: glycosyltransferase family 2 protein [Patescibacteria group bacterium]|nr:glycosyltransferase family 2 protein [Patescibacteria group bacterium]